MVQKYISTFHGFPIEQRILQDFTPELQWPEHLQISFVMNGSLRIHHKNHTSTYHTHDFFFFLPYETYSVISSAPSTRVLSVHFDADYLSGLCPDINRVTMQKNHVTCDITNPVYLRLCQGFSAIIFNNLKKEITSRLKLLQGANDMVLILLDSYGITSDSSSGTSYSSERVRKILSYINENYMKRIRVTDISSYLGLHPQYFSAFFQKTFHTGFVEYLNTFRINHSLSELLYTEHSILDIALNHGFSSHKTYAAFFRRLYSASPTEYRNQERSTPVQADSAPSGRTSPDEGTFAYFRQFLQADTKASLLPHNFSNQRSLRFDTEKLMRTVRQNHQERFLSLGRAYACLRSEIQEQILQVKKEYDFDFLRVRDIFSDDLYIYYAQENSEPVYNWASLDSVFDFILSAGLKPFPEIGYMPSMLASKKQYSNWQYHPNVSFPKSISRWKELIREFLTHYINRYGIQELKGWYFDFWTSPDLKIKNPLWNEGMDDFFRLYQATYEVFVETDPSLRLGSPNFSTIDGWPWYESFFQFCNDKGLSPAYISTHLYGCEGNFSADISRSVDDYSVSNQQLIPEHLRTLQSIMDEYGFHSTDIIVSDWNLTFLPKDFIRDTCYMGPFICHTVNKTLFSARGLSFWSLNDNYEDFFPSSKLFRGGAGLLDIHGLKKASFNTMVLLGMLGTQILACGTSHIFTKKGEEYQLLLYNLPKFDYMYSIIDTSAMDETHRYNIYSNTESHLYSIAIQLPKGTYYIKKYEVNREYGSAYDIWGQIGFPPSLTKDIEDYIRENSKPHISYSYQNIEKTLFLDETVPAHGVTLLRIIPK